MTDERIDALVRRLDVAAGPDPAFVASTMVAMRTRARAARHADATTVGRLLRNLRTASQSLGFEAPRRAVVLVALIGLLLAAFVASVLVVGALNRNGPLGNGPLIASVDGVLTAIDLDLGITTPIGSAGERVVHVSRSPDGRSVVYWQLRADGDRMFRVGVDGSGVTRLAGDRQISMGGCIDVWSRDSRSLAAEVVDGGSSRIVVSEGAPGRDQYGTPDGVVAHCPLWSPDGRWIAFASGADPDRALAVIGADGVGLRSVSGDIGGEPVDGADTWSPDGTWVYFGTDRSIWRANVMTGRSVRLSEPGVIAAAPTVSPDGSLLSFSLSTAGGWDVYVANADGTAPRRVLDHARNNGWSADGRYVLARWLPAEGPGGLALVTPEGDMRVAVPAAASCPDPAVSCDMSWGQDQP